VSDGSQTDRRERRWPDRSAARWTASRSVGAGLQAFAAQCGDDGPDQEAEQLVCGGVWA
jgi:hypothetical protein